MVQSAHKTYEIRCPIYGFITLSDWEREIISQPAFQRLRRIRQLAWTDYVYPGAMHTRFEHSLGVMHMATMLYDGVVDRSSDILRSQFGYNKDGLGRHRILIRLAALLHDVGHGPFSHAAEELLPFGAGGDQAKRWRHEHYSAAIVRRYFADVIENHPLNTNYELKAEHVATFLENGPGVGKALFWRDLIDGQMDADRMDYLLRDSHHAGVDYGRYDWRRLLHTVVAVSLGEEGGPRLGVTEGGWHAAEALILARYFMFMQVYFHKTRVIFDYHLQEALKVILPDGRFPPPEGEGLEKYLSWHDWRVLSLLESEGGEHGRRLATRDHYREVAHTPEVPSAEDEGRLTQQRAVLGDLMRAEISSGKSWYRIGNADVPVIAEDGSGKVSPLSKYSSIVKNVGAVHQIRLYVKSEDCEEAHRRLAQVGGDQ